MSQVNVELLHAATATISLNQADVRQLAGVPAGTISMSDLQGKSNTYDVSYLVVAGGGGGGTDGGGGGGAGGVRTGTYTLTPSAVYTFSVGAGGAAGQNISDNGGDSSFGIITATGGGYGGYNIAPHGDNGGVGGSGGGGASLGVGAAGISGQGYGGANGGSGGPYNGGGGGGAGSAASGGAGGIGYTSSITGSSVTYAIGGNGSSSSPSAGYGSGGGGGAPGLYGSNGNAGVSIIAIPSARYTGIYTGSPAISTAGGNVVLQFFSSGSYTA